MRTASKDTAYRHQNRSHWSKGSVTIAAACALSLYSYSIASAQNLAQTDSPVEDIIIDVPELSIVGAPPLDDIIIEVPALNIVVGPEEEETNTTIGRATATKQSAHSTEEPDRDVANKVPLHWCIGSFAAHFGHGKGTAVGFAMPFGAHNTVAAQIRPVGCTTALDLNINGQPIALTQADATRTYSGSINLGDGAKRTLFLTCEEDLNLRGYLEAKDANLRITRPVWFIRRQDSDSIMPDCEEPQKD